MSRIATLLDALLRRTAHLIPGVVSGGAFYRHQQPLTRFAMWTEPGAYMVQVARLELVFDRP